jgi:hypothetical protein
MLGVHSAHGTHADEAYGRLLVVGCVWGDIGVGHGVGGELGLGPFTATETWPYVLHCKFRQGGG